MEPSAIADLVGWVDKRKPNTTLKLYINILISIKCYNNGYNYGYLLKFFPLRILKT